MNKKIVILISLFLILLTGCGNEQKIYEKTLYTRVDEAIKNENYQSALYLLNDAPDWCISKKSYQKKISQCTDLYIDYTLAEAGRAFANEQDYDSAMLIISNTISIVGNRKALTDAYDKYAEFIPVKLERDYSEKGANIDFDNVTTYDVNENKHLGFTVYPYNGYASNTEANASIVYPLNAKYNTFTGTLYRTYESSDVRNWDLCDPARALIYGDGILLYESPVFGENTFEIIHLSIDVSGVNELTIVMYGWANSVLDSKPLIRLADMTVQKSMNANLFSGQAKNNNTTQIIESASNVAVKFMKAFSTGDFVLADEYTPYSLKDYEIFRTYSIDSGISCNYTDLNSDDLYIEFNDMGIKSISDLEDVFYDYWSNFFEVPISTWDDYCKKTCRAREDQRKKQYGEFEINVESLGEKDVPVSILKSKIYEDWGSVGAPIKILELLTNFNIDCYQKAKCVTIKWSLDGKEGEVSTINDVYLVWAGDSWKAIAYILWR